MARLWSSGMELADFAKEGVEDISGGAAISSLAARSGQYGMRMSPGASVTYINKFYRAANTPEDVYARLYVRLNALPASGSPNPLLLPYTDATSPLPAVSLTSAGTLRLYNLTTNTQIGSDSAALTLGTWYRVELRVNSTTPASTFWEATLDGTVIASTTVTADGGFKGVTFGLINPWSGTWEIDLDDVAINDSTGSVQNSYPGAGSIVHCFVTGDGDTTNRGTQGSDWETGPTAGAGASTVVDDRPTPDDAASYLELKTNSSGPANRVSFFAVDDASAAGVTEPIALVQVGARVAGAKAQSCSFVLAVTSQPGGTSQESAPTAIASVSWHTHDDGDPHVYQLTSYVDPQAGGAWTAALIDTMEIGVRAPDATPNVRVTQLWALVEYAG